MFYNENRCELLDNLDNVHTTQLGVERIKKNLSLDTDDVVHWCREKIQGTNAVIFRRGKNWYINIGDFQLTVNAYNYTIITAHTQKNRYAKSKCIEGRKR
jgi:hypothetical protein